MKTSSHPIDYFHRPAPTAETVRQLQDWMAAAGVEPGDSQEVVREKIRQYIERINKIEAVSA